MQCTEFNFPQSSKQTHRGRFNWRFMSESGHTKAEGSEEASSGPPHPSGEEETLFPPAQAASDAVEEASTDVQDSVARPEPLPAVFTEDYDEKLSETGGSGRNEEIEADLVDSRALESLAARFDAESSSLRREESSPEVKVEMQQAEVSDAGIELVEGSDTPVRAKSTSAAMETMEIEQGVADVPPRPHTETPPPAASRSARDETFKMSSARIFRRQSSKNAEEPDRRMRDFIDDNLHNVEDEDDSSDLISGYGMESSEYDDGEPYQDLEGASCMTRLCLRLRSSTAALRWQMRNTGKSMQPGRLLDRDNAFHQCSGRLHISQHASGRTAAEIIGLYGDDWFHVMLSFATWQLMLIMLLIYTVNLLMFAALYMAVDRPGQDCGIASAPSEAVSFQTAFAFSLITSSTIGYGFPASGDPFFQDCVSLVVVVYFQVIISLAINALVVGLVLQRLGRADSRSHQVLFSNKACIRCIHGHFYFMFQVYDLDRRHPVVEAHVRTYAVFHETDGTDTVHFQTRYMRLQNPNDELGGVLFLSVPCTVVHAIDQWSPLMSPEMARLAWEKADDGFVHNASNRYVFPGLILREADAETGNRDATSCPVCGETFPTDQHLLRHIRYMQWEEKSFGMQPVLDKDAVEKLFPPDNVFGIHQSAADTIGASHLPDGAYFGLKESTRRAMAGNESDEDTTTEEFQQRQPPRRASSEGARKRKASQIRMVHRKRQAKKNQLLQFYADLSTPIGHQDVDMNLLQTEVNLVPEGEEGRDKRNLGDILSIFEQHHPQGGEPSVGAPSSKLADDADANLFASAPVGSQPHPPRGSSFAQKKFKKQTKSVESFRKRIEEHIEKSGIEIIVLVEGIEARSSNTFQARHSYTFDDIEFDKYFTPCMDVSMSGHAEVNLNSFHRTIPVPSHVNEIIGASHT